MAKKQATNTSKTLRDLRGNRTLPLVAKAAGVDIGALSRYERGENEPRANTRKKLAAYYGVSEADILKLVIAAKAINQ